MSETEACLIRCPTCGEIEVEPTDFNQAGMPSEARCPICGNDLDLTGCKEWLVVYFRTGKKLYLILPAT